MARTDRILVGIDVGSAKVGVLVGKRLDEVSIEIVGQGFALNRGTRRGNIVNEEATVAALRAATEEAEMMAGHEVEEAYVGIGGFDIRSFNSRGMAAVTRRDRDVREPDVDRVLEAAQSAALPADREILHAVAQEFIVDGQGGIADPVGMSGNRLEVAVHLVTGHGTRSRTLQRCVNRAGIRIRELVFEPLATAAAVLQGAERESGTLVVDLGGGTSGYALFLDGEVQHSGVCPMGASHFTGDLAQVLRTPFEEAERLKCERGACLESLVGGDEGITIPLVGNGRTQVVRRRELCRILQPRAEEIFQWILDDLLRVGRHDQIRGGIVLTGGGAQLEGLAELAEQMFNTGVRPGLPNGFSGLVQVIESPAWSTAAGLLRYGQLAEDAPSRRARQGLSLRSMVGSLRGMFSDLL